jgi:DNA-binding GntR family transcriptional regulator
MRLRYQAGASPIREALNRLMAEGLVVLEDQKGFKVAQVSTEDLQELTRTRCWINDISLRDAIAHGDAKWEEQIVLAFHWLSRLEAKSGDLQGANWDGAHLEFHSALIRSCRSRWIRDFAATLFIQACRYQHLSIIEDAPDRDVQSEHRAIMDATIARDADRAVRLANEHIMRTAHIVIEVSGKDGERTATEPKSAKLRRRPPGSRARATAGS